MSVPPARVAVVFLAVATLLADARWAGAQLVAGGTSLTATTANAVATFAGPDLVGFVNAATGESYLTNPSAGELAVIDQISGGGGLTASHWAIGPEPGTGDPQATITAQGPGRTLTLQVKIDSDSQEIVIRLQASVTAPGLRSARWSLAGLDIANGRLIVPANSGLVFDRAHPGTGVHLEYPNEWQAQMAVYESARGSVVLYSTDQTLSFKQLLLNTRGQSTLDVGVATRAVAPFSSATSVPTIEWRLKAFAGDWRTAAQTYKTWLAVNRPPVSNAAHPWVANIRAVALLGIDTNLLGPLAARLVPSQTLIYLHDWRQNGYDENYPDYTPRAGVAAFIAAAHGYGFKVMLHTDLIGVSDYNPDYQSVKAWHVRTPETLQPMGWIWDRPPSTPNRFAYINPAAAAYRSLFISRLASGLAGLGVDALHLDISAPGYNDGNGLIEGRTYPQGSAKLHEELVAAFPSIALAGEGENDFLYRYESFAQAWALKVDAPGHPIAAFLFSPQTRYYGHLGQPQAHDPAFKPAVVELARRAILPTLMFPSVGDLTAPGTSISRVLDMIGAWQSHDFTPAWNSPWQPGRVRWEGTGGSTAEFTDAPTLATMVAAGTTMWRVAHGADRQTTTSYIPSWPAFDAATLFGLDPASWHFLENTPRPDSTHITSLPSGVQLGSDTLVGSAFASVSLSAASSSGFDLVSHLVDGRPGVRYGGVDTAIGNGAVVQQSSIVAGGVSRSGLFIHPPWQGQVGGETFVEYQVAVSAGASLRFAVGVADNATCTDGVTFKVSIDGAEVWSQHVLRTGWLDSGIDLGAYAGRTVPLRIISHPGPAANPGCDWAVWSGARIDATPAATGIDVPLALAPGSIIAGFDGRGSLTVDGPLAVRVRDLHVPGRFTLFTKNGIAVTAGTALASVAFDAWNAGANEVAQPGAVFGAGSLGPGASGGVTKSPAIWAHPPSGRTILSWPLRLPAQPLRLSWSAGLRDGSRSFDGVDFEVRVNGFAYWRMGQIDPQWMTGAIEMGRWSDQNVVIELVTSSRNDYTGDWAQWADVMLTASSAACTFSVPATAAVGRGGGAIPLAVTAPPSCPWTATSSVPWLTFATGTDGGSGNGSVTVSVWPNPGGARSGTVTIAGRTVTVTQDAGLAAPVSVDDTYATVRATPLTIAAPGVLQNDDARDGGAMNASLVTATAHGVLALDAGGGFTYTPEPGFLGIDSFTYRAVNAGGPGNPATVTIAVSETTGPLPPTGLYVSSMSGNTLTLRFTPPTLGPPITGYVLEGGIAPGQVMASILVGANPIYTLTAPSGAFYIRVHSLSGAARSVASNEIRIFVNTPAPPSAPADLTGLASGSALALAWRNTFAGGAATSLVLDVSGSITTSLPIGLSESFAFNGVPAGTYTLSLRAANASGASASSNAVTVTFPAGCAGPPLPPANFLAYRDATTIFVIWDPAPTGPAPTSYVLNVTGSFIGSFPTTGRMLSGAVGPGTYQLSVAAVNACGSGTPTPVQTIAVP